MDTPDRHCVFFVHAWNHRDAIWFHDYLSRVRGLTPNGAAPQGLTIALNMIGCGVQGEVLSLGHDTQNTAPASKPAAEVREKDQQMGSALRSVYQKTVDEAIPDDLLDLLGKLD